MNLKKTLLASMLLASVEVGAVIPPGDYEIVINETPTFTFYGITFFDFGTDGAWNSNFTFGGNPPTQSESQGMPDTALQIDTPSGKRGSGIGGDGYAGVIDINVTNDVNGNSNFTVTSFSKDLIFGTAGGNFVQYGTVVDDVGTIAGTGTIDNNCKMTFIPTGRLGAIGGTFGVPPVPGGLHDKRWNVEPFSGATTWTEFTTGTFTIPTLNGQRITGRPVTIHPSVDVNNDGAPDFKTILVTGGQVGEDWPGFAGNPFFEIWNVDIVSVNVPVPAPVHICTGAEVKPPLPPVPESTNSRESFNNSIGCSLSSNSQHGSEWLLTLFFLILLRSRILYSRIFNHGDQHA